MCVRNKYLLNIDCAIDFCPLSGLINWNIKLKMKLRRYANFFLHEADCRNYVSWDRIRMNNLNHEVGFQSVKLTFDDKEPLSTLCGDRYVFELVQFPRRGPIGSYIKITTATHKSVFFAFVFLDL